MREKVYLYLIYQDSNNDYDTYDSAVVVANNEAQAKHIHPSEYSTYWWDRKTEKWVWLTKTGDVYEHTSKDWVPPSKVTVQKVGVAVPPLAVGTVVCSSYNAG